MTDTTTTSATSGARGKVERRLSSALLGLVVACFVLPFVAVGCGAPAGYGSGGGGASAKYSGLVLAVGGDARVQPAHHRPPPGASRREDHIDAQPLVLVGFLLLIASFGLSIAMRRRRPGSLAALAVLVAAILIAGVLHARHVLTNAIVAKLTQLHPEKLARAHQSRFVSIDPGFEIVVVLLALVALTDGVTTAHHRRRARRAAPG